MSRKRKGNRQKKSTLGNRLAKQRFFDEYVGDAAATERNYVSETFCQMESILGKIDNELGNTGMQLIELSTLKNEIRFDKSLRYSNDILIEDVVRRIVRTNRKWTGNVLKRFFFGKVRSFSPEAAAVRELKEDGSYLIVFNVGLSIACDFLSKCIVSFVNISTGSAQKEFVSDLIEVFSEWKLNNCVDLHKAFAFQKKYNIEDSEYAINIAIATDSFIISHEIAHHLLGDTNTTIYQTPTTKGLNTSLDDFIRSLGIDEKREVRADMLAIHIMLGNAELCGSDIEELATSSVGAMVTLLAVGLFSANSIKESSSDYPSSSTRFHSLLAFCESLLLVNTANSLKSGNLIMANIEKSMLARQRMDSVAKIFIEVEDFFNEDG